MPNTTYSVPEKLGILIATEPVFFMMLVIAMASIALARAIERNKLGAGLEAIRDDEESA